MASNDTKRCSLAELRAMRNRGETRTAAFAPEREVDKAFWDTAQLIPLDPRKVHTGLRIDADVLDWFKVRGRLADQDERGVALVL